MDINAFFDSEVFNWIIMPILIFVARVADVSIGTIRIIFVSKGMKLLAPLCGFFEILIWLIAIGKVFQNFTNPIYYIAYAGGFATGNYVGIIIEERLAIGLCVIRTVTRRDATNLIEFLRAAGYGVTTMDAQGASGPVKIIYTVVRRYDIEQINGVIQKYNPKAFYSIEDVRFASEGAFPLLKPWYRRGFPGSLLRQRKGK
jgi:uncharacterized protein YebE (UPF0316 family)